MKAKAVSRQAVLSIVMVFICICASGCMSQGNNDSGDRTRIISVDSNFSNNGELYLDNQNRLNFLDFVSMQSAIICPRPNCTHTEADGCPSFGMMNCPFIYGNHLYYFDYETKYCDDKFVWLTSLYKCDLDGTNRSKIRSLEGLRIMYYDRLVLCGDMLYFAPVTVGYEESGITSGYSEARLYSYSFSENKLDELCKLGGGYGLNTYLWGEADGDIYVDVSYHEEDIPFDELMDILMNSDESIYIRESYKYNTSDGLLSVCDPHYKPIQGGYLCRFEDQGATLYLPCGEIYAEDMTNDIYDVYDINSAGEYIFDLKDMLAIKINSGEKYSLPEEYKADFVYYIDGYYIFKKLNRDTGIYEYEKISEDSIKMIEK